MRVYLENNKQGVLSDCDGILSRIRREFTVRDPNPRSRSKWSYITPIGRFQIGLWYNIRKFVSMEYPDLTVNVDREFQLAYEPSFGDGLSVISIPGVEYRDYQESAIRECLRCGRGIVLHGTSSGKTVTMGGLAKSILDRHPDKRILVMVPGLTLLTQTLTEFHSFGIEYDVWVKTKLELDKAINVWISNFEQITANFQTAQNLFSDFDVVVVDEVHFLKAGNQITKFVSKLKTHNKFGFTGTLPELIHDEWNVVGKIGPVLSKKPGKELRAEGYACPLKVVSVRLEHKGSPDPVSPVEMMDRPSLRYEKEMDFLYSSSWRNQLLVKTVGKISGNSLVLVNRINHGEYLEELIRQNGNKTVEFVRGNTATDDRDAIKKYMEGNSNVVCVAMDKIFSTGVSINNLHNLFFVYIGKSQTLILQSLGRMMRLHSSKEYARIFDFSDTTEYSTSHYTKRLKLYNKEEMEIEIKKISETGS